MHSTAERRQMILQALCERRSELHENLAVEFGVTTRTIYNDIEILAYSYPIYTVQGIGGGHLCRRWFSARYEISNGGSV